MTDADTIREALGLLNSMVVSGEAHTAKSVGVIGKSVAALARLEAELTLQARFDAEDAHIKSLTERAEALEQRVAFLVAEAHGWQPKLEAAEAERDEVQRKLARGWDQTVAADKARAIKAEIRAEAAEAERDALREQVSTVEHLSALLTQAEAERDDALAKFDTANREWSVCANRMQAAEARADRYAAALQMIADTVYPATFLGERVDGTLIYGGAGDASRFARAALAEGNTQVSAPVASSDPDHPSGASPEGNDGATGAGSSAGDTP
jgi:hypothetical protein